MFFSFLFHLLSKKVLKKKKIMMKSLGEVNGQPNCQMRIDQGKVEQTNGEKGRMCDV